MVVIKRPDDPEIENQLEKFQDEFQDLKTRMSDLRKKGKDTRIAELLTLDFSPRVTMARVTYDKSDIDKVGLLIADLKKELDEAEQGRPFEHVMDMIKNTYEFLREDNKEEATKTYAKIMELYKDLPHDLKRSVYVACLDIREKIENG